MFIAYGETRLNGIKLPETIKILNNNTFIDIKTITIPNSVTEIGKSAFLWCSSLTNIIIPNSIDKICSHAFSPNCKILKIEIV